MKTYILAALLGSMNAVQLGHRHHHRHHHPRNIGVRFINTGIEIGDEPPKALPKVEAPVADKVSTDEKVAQALDAAKAEAAAKDKAAADAKEAEANAKEGEKLAVVKKDSQVGTIMAGIAGGKVGDSPLAPPPTEEELRAANAAAGKPDALINKQEYAEMKKEVKELKAKLDELPPELPEDEQKAADNKKIDDLVDEADFVKHEKQEKLFTAELTTIKARAEEIKKMDNDPNDHRQEEEKEAAAKQLKKDEKQAAKLVGQLAEVKKALVVDKEKSQERKNELAEQEAADKAAAAEIAKKEKLVRDFEMEKKQADNAQTEEFEKALPAEEPKAGKEVKEEDKKLKEAMIKIDAMNKADEAKEEAKEKAAEEAKAEQLPNIGAEAQAKALADFDAQKAAQQAAAAAKEQAALAEVAVKKQAINVERAVNKEKKGEEWTGSMPSYIINSVPFKPPK